MTESLAQLSRGALSDLAGVFAAMPEDALDGWFCCNDIGSRCTGGGGRAQAAWPLMRRYRTSRR
jgi:hypothetical protein